MRAPGLDSGKDRITPGLDSGEDRITPGLDSGEDRITSGLDSGEDGIVIRELRNAAISSEVEFLQFSLSPLIFYLRDLNNSLVPVFIPLAGCKADSIS